MTDRTATVTRNTLESQITVTVNLDDTPRKNEYPRAEIAPQLREQKGK